MLSGPISRLMQAFRTSRDGNVAIIFGLASIPIMFMVGAGIDYSRSSAEVMKLQSDVDATTLALCKSSSTTVADLQKTAQTMLAAYSPSYPVTIDTLNVTGTPRNITLAAHISYPTTIAKLMNVSALDLHASATCTVGEIYYEIALVLDTTGSMANSAGGTSKIKALRTAATNFVTQMFSTIDPKYLKISLVPFAASVKVDPTTYANATWLDTQGKSQYHWQNVTNPSGSGFTSRLDIFKKLANSNASWGWAGCLESLPYPLNVQDGAPVPSNPDSYYVPLFAPDEVGNSSDYSVGNNSYIDDGLSKNSNTCDNNPSSNSTRMGQACKYTDPQNVRTSREGPNWMCTSRALTRLTSNKTTLLSEISQLQANGNTDIHEGLMWGWRTISPVSVFADDAAPYQSPTRRTVKIIVLMTDGMNTWTDDNSNPVTGSYYSAYGYFTNADGSKPNARLPSGNANPSTSGQARAAMDALTAESCTNAKAAGVTIYSVGFSVWSDPIDSAGQTLLQNCASQSSNYFLASNSTTLDSAFGSIAQGIGQLRLTH